ncbi:hypothetical protein B9Q17_06470 [Marinobacter vinifirmus]|uniref:Metallophosphoesterase n=2 Tax=Marinobacter vinifirmus TaxID=355591 RepID=A0A7Z1DSS8_9GAMM|nr:hypothetical protein B9Q17_06470 [Marinobacter vinifirmus]
MRLTPHRFIAANPVGVDWVCGDLHGEFDALQAALSGAHELMFIAGAEDNRNRYKHRGMGGDWAASLDEASYKNLATQCRYQLPLTMTLECENGQLELVHAQSPFDDWRTVQECSFSERFAIECTWPWNRAQGKDQTITGISAVVSGHIGTVEIIQRGNQVWIDVLARTGQVPLMPAHRVLERVAQVQRGG